ncbi:hypothetical protein LTS10_007636 [Elasticomyces elasticus]|nr:hypothetical protein LTS10_007636 [Elasticomyces elasticus]
MADLRIKALPTNFTSLYSPTNTQISLPERVIRQDDGQGIDDRYVFIKQLGSGFVNITTTWPAEIEAGLLLSQTQSVGEATIVPVIDYFTLRHNTSVSWSWAMVTPYTPGGTLVTLASASRQQNRSPEELDLTFRPAFERLLTDLSMLHAAGYCHDDVKPGNIFVQSPTRWLVGDLGNLRQKSHPWHDTHSWTRRLQWADCELNDARRAVKTYMSFLRAASADVDEFDREFLAGAGWSRIYWEFMARPILMSAIPIAVTGATGGVGGFVARNLVTRQLLQRLLVRTPSKAPKLPYCEVHQFSYSDHAATSAALKGVHILFMVSASESSQRLDQHRCFVDAAVNAGVQHVVYTSFMGAAPDAIFTLARDHYTTEEYIKASGMRWTFLRNSFYIDLLDSIVGTDDVIRGPSGSGRVSIVAREDIARLAAAVLADPSQHAGITYNVTGREALSMSDIAATISASRGRDVRFHDETIEEAYASRQSYGVPDWQMDAWVSTYTAIRSNVMAPVSNAIGSVTGSAPMTLAEYLTANP